MVAFFALIVLPRATLPMADGDAWWHIHAGEAILATGRVPDSNTWTIAGEGFPWISQDWLSNVAMAALFNAGPWGPGWLSLAFAAVVVGAFGFLWLAVERRTSGGWLGRFLLLTAGLIVAGPIIGIRVQTIDLLMTATTVAVLWAYLSDPRLWRALLLIPVATIWVNLHAGWVMLFLLGGAVLLGELADRRLGRQLPRAPLTMPQLGELAAGLGAAACALVINPNGIQIYGYPFATASIAAHRDFLVEWSAPNLGSFEGQATIGFLVLVVMPTFAIGWRRLRTADVLWLVGLSVLALGAVRFALFLGPVAASIAAVHLPEVVPSVRRLAARWERPPRTGVLRGVNAGLFATVVILGLGLAVARAAPGAQARAVAESVPIQAAAWLDEESPDARIFNTYSWGGYLARRLPEAKVYIDGRSDIYGNEVIQRYAATLNVSIDPSELLDGEAIDVALLKPDAPLRDWLDGSSRWHRAYEDDQAVVWTRSED
jgi:hypothetical protein